MLNRMRSWTAPEGWLRITAIDARTGGEPCRVITSGYPDLPGDTILARRRHAREHLDHLGTALIWEPRGHADTYGCIVIPPVTPEADIGVISMHNEGYSTMCGHGIIGSCSAGRIVRTTASGPYPAIIPEIQGTAHITGRHEFLIDPTDPLRSGFILR